MIGGGGGGGGGNAPIKAYNFEIVMRAVQHSILILFQTGINCDNTLNIIT